MDQHVLEDLSAYADEALPELQMRAVGRHLDACPLCAGCLLELRAASRLIAALPAARPSRRLVPVLVPRYRWLRPLRSFAAAAAGVFLFVFMASATLETGFRMGGGGTASTASETTSDRSAPGPQPATQPQASPGAFGAAPPAVPVPSVTDRSLAGGVTPTPSVGDAGATQPSLTPSAPAERAAASPGGRDAVAPQRTAPPVRVGPSPWLWLALMLASAATAYAAHRRLRTR